MDANSISDTAVGIKTQNMLNYKTYTLSIISLDRRLYDIPPQTVEQKFRIVCP